MFGKNAWILPNIGKTTRRAIFNFCQTLAKFAQICQTLAKRIPRAAGGVYSVRPRRARSGASKSSGTQSFPNPRPSDTPGMFFPW